MALNIFRLGITMLAIILGYSFGADWPFAICSLLGITFTTCLAVHIWFVVVKPWYDEEHNQ